MLGALAETLPSFPLDRSVQSTNTGVLLLDVMPLITMLPCVPTLRLYWRTRRFGDLAFFGVGFFIAAQYHICQLHPEGLTGAELLGLPGPVWRSLDILGAQCVLARTVGHALGASTQLVSGVANFFFPAALMAYAHMMGGLSLAACSKVLLFIMACTLAAKLAVEGKHTIPHYCPRRGIKLLAWYVAGFTFFALPELLGAQTYWLCHSLWHVFLSMAYYELYQFLTEEEQHDAAGSSKAA